VGSYILLIVGAVIRGRRGSRFLAVWTRVIRMRIVATLEAHDFGTSVARVRWSTKAQWIDLVIPVRKSLVARIERAAANVQPAVGTIARRGAVLVAIRFTLDDLSQLAR
jgi:hypothetical protein